MKKRSSNLKASDLPGFVITEGGSDANPDFPWEHVNRCLKYKLNGEDFKNHYKCPKCRLESEKLTWINFNSPDWTWENLCGRAGPLSICPNCNIQVEFICRVMN